VGLWKLKRRVTNLVMLGGTWICTAIVVVPVVMVLYYVVLQGYPALSIEFLTQMPKPVGEPGGGMANALVGSLILVGGACLIGLPIGVLGGIYLAEFGQNRFGWWVRFFSDVLNGVPSIVMGVFVYCVVVVPMGHCSALSGCIALGLMMVPLVMRTTEDLVAMVPRSQREASLALGATHARTVFSIVLPIARGGVITGILLAVARIAGETAPLLFTAFGNRFFNTSLKQPIASLPVQIYTYAIAPYDDWHAQAWAGALVLVGLVFVLSVVARVATRGQIRVVQ